jgi:diguanylate cyclase (GGDEF)-like protein
MNNDLAYIDDITGLGNRRAYKRDMDIYLNMPDAREKGLFVVVMDLDHFKSVNDLEGHLSGDSMIKVFSEILSKNLKGDNVTIIRYGGDEFVAVITGMNLEDVLSACESLRQEFFDRKFIINENNTQITVSIGIAEYPEDGTTTDDLFARADEALYNSKHLGRNRVSLARNAALQVKEERRVIKELSFPIFISRDRQLKEAEAILLRENPRKFTTIRGDMGTGKSRFLQETANLTKAKSKKAFLINCAEHDKAKPYSLAVNIIAALSKAGTEHYSDVFLTLPLQQQAALSFIPRLRAFAPDDKARDRGKNPRTDLFYGIVNILDGLVKKLRPVIFIDNMDLTDECSVEAIACLVMLYKDTPLCICASDSRQVSADKPHRASFLDNMLNKISEFEIIDKIDMQAFTKDATCDFLKGIFQTAEFSQLFMDNFYNVTKGNPFFATELLRDFLDKRIITLTYPVWVFDAEGKDFPASLQELLMRKLDRLNADEKEILFAAAGIGGNFKFDFLSKLKKINSGYLQDMVFRAEDINILSSQEGTLEGEVYFQNDIMKSLVYAAANEDSRKKLHNDIAEVIVETEGKMDIEYMSAEIAYHFRKADIKYEAEKYAELAVQYADRVFSNTEADALIENIINERESADKLELIKEEAWPAIIMAIKWFNSIVKTMFFYGRTNFITDKAIGSFMDNVKYLFELQGSITVSLPVGLPEQQISLLVNGSMLYPSSVFEQNICNSMADLMIDLNIGSITFLKNISPSDMHMLVELINGLNTRKKEKKDWSSELSGKNINGIKIDQVLYRRVLSGDEKKKYRSELIKDTVSAGALIESIVSGLGRPASDEAPLAGNSIKRVVKEEKNILAKMITKLDLKFLVEMISEEYSGRDKHIQDIKDMSLICLEHIKDKKGFVSLLWDSLRSLGMSQECFKWLTDKKEFIEYPIRKKANIYLHEDIKTILEMGASKDFYPTLKELFALGEGNIAKNIINKYLENYRSRDPHVRGYLARVLNDMMSALPDEIIYDYAQKVSQVYIELLKSENDRVLFRHMAKHANFLIDKLMSIKGHIYVYDIISAAKDEIITGIDMTLFCSKLFSCVKKTAVYEDIKALIDILGLFGKLCVPYILGFLVLKFSDTITFEYYMQELRLMMIIRKFKNVSLSELDKISRLKCANRHAIDYIKDTL